MGVKVAFQEVEDTGDSRRSVSGVLVPQAAIREIEDRDYVFVVDQGIVERRAVSTAGARGSDILVISGLVADERVVLDAPPELADGVSVREKKQ